MALKAHHALIVPAGQRFRRPSALAVTVAALLTTLWQIPGHGAVEQIAAQPDFRPPSSKPLALRTSGERITLRQPIVPSARLEAGSSADRLSLYRQRGQQGDAAGEGYFPTTLEWKKIDQYYPRRDGDQAGGLEDDARTQAPAGLWPYPSATPGFFEAHPSLVPFADKYLGYLMSSGSGAVVQGKNPSTGLDMNLGLDVPLLTRAFNPERATFKLGLVYLDVLSLTGTVIYSDYHGPEHFAPHQGDGWLGQIALDLRVVIPLTPSIYLAAAGELYYLPRNNKVGFTLQTNGAGAGLGTGAHIVYEHYAGGWWFNVAEGFSLENRFSDNLDSASVNEIDVAGRYRFGRENDARAQGGYFDNNRLLLESRADATAVGPVGGVWRLQADLSHFDDWELDGFRHRPQTTQLNALLEYAGQDWRFAPFTGFQTTWYGDGDTLRHEVFVGAKGPITQQLRLYARIGYAFGTGEASDDDGLLAEAGLTQQLGPYTQQSLYGGTNVAEFRRGHGDIGHYLRYTLEQRFSSRVIGTAFVQGDRVHNLETGQRETDLITGVSLQVNLTDFTQLQLTPSYQRRDPDDGPVEHHWLFAASVTHRIRPNLYGTFLYQYEEEDFTDRTPGFAEHLFELSLTQLF